MRTDSMTERWMLYVDTTLQAGRCPWGTKLFEALAAADVTDMPGMTFDFGVYSPSDGNLDISHVPVRLPRQVPVCVTGLAVCHDDEAMYVIQRHDRPTDAIPELAANGREDFSLVVQLAGHWRGLYFGMDELGRHIGCVQIWDKVLCPEGAVEEQYPWSLLRKNPGSGPGGSSAGILGSDVYTARVIATPGGIVAVWRIAKGILASGMDGNRLHLSSARLCYCSGEQVAWGAGIMWSPRKDMMGTVTLADTPAAAKLPRVRRVDVEMDFRTEEGVFHATWDGADAATLARINTGQYAGFNQKCSMALNGTEQVMALAAGTEAAFAIPDGLNRLEMMTSHEPIVPVVFQKVSSRRVTPPAHVKPQAMPSMEELKVQFGRWHAAEETIYHKPGAWGNPPIKGGRMCLCHAGVFHMLPYALACRYLDTQAVYLDRVRETTERMLSFQKPDGWYPCYCSGAPAEQEPERFQGGAFTNGSVGEAMAVARLVLGDESLLASSRRAADAYRWYEWEMNENYSAFALWHLAELYEQTHEARDLERAIYYARYFAGRDIGLCGAQDAHNFYSGYGNITLKGLARLLRILPDTHSFYPVLRARVLRFANQILFRMQPDGRFAGRNRSYVGYTHSMPGLFEVARALPEEAPALEPVFCAMYADTVAALDSVPVRFGDGYEGLVLVLLARYQAEKGRK